MDKQLSDVRHDYIRYANCWEDADVLMTALEVRSGDRILSIGSAGDNSFSMLAYDPEIVVAVDINIVQLNLIELKKAAISQLNHKDYLAFIGFNRSSQRMDLFLKVKEALTPELAAYWAAREQDIIKGLIHQGKFEKYFQLFHGKILPKIHTKSKISELFREKGQSEQASFFKRKWNNKRWRLLFKIFFSKFVMGRFGRDPKFLKEVQVKVSSFILSQAERHLSSIECQHNYFLQYILTGNFNPDLPHYAREENYYKIKANITRITVYNGLAEDAFKEFDDFNKFNLSNIFEYMDKPLFKQVADNLISNGRAGSRYAYWNLMVPRSMPDVNNGVKSNHELSNELSKIDKGFFYGKFNIDVKN